MLATRDNLDLAHRLMEIGDEMSKTANLCHIAGFCNSWLKLEEERSGILEELGMALAVFLLEEGS